MGDWKLRINRVCIALAAAFFAVAMLLSAVFLCVYDKAFYRDTYRELGIYESIGMSQEDLLRATDALLDYCRDERDDITLTVTVNGESRPAFSDREVQHMQDVKKLAMGARGVRNILFLLFAAFFIAGIWRMRRRGGAFQPFLIGLLSGVALLAAVGLYAATDFGAFWTRFHLLFFTNDLWMLNPATSLLIRMVPEAFFFKLVMRILLYYGIAMVACLAVCAAGMVLYGRRRARKE